VFRSVGYRGVALPGLPFDKKAGTIPHHGGRVLCAGKPLPGVYVTGWIKRGPSGIIGTNKPDSAETVASMLRDLPNLPECPEPSTKPLRDLLEERGAEPVTFGGWKRLDEAERERGESRGKVREKFTRVEEMVKRAQQENRKA
jgi:ferredoxin--NADP+ reductase